MSKSVKTPKKKKNSRAKAFPVLGVIAALAALAIFVPAIVRLSAQKAYTSLFDQKAELLREAVFSNADVEDSVGQPLKVAGVPYAVFISVCDIDSRAVVLTGTGSTLSGAWSAAVGKARKYVGENEYDALWVKADVVNAVEKTGTEALTVMLQPYYDEMFRLGVSFDGNFETAFLESEINGNKLIDYDTDTIDLETINNYLTGLGRTNASTVPDSVYLFSCLGYFCDDGDAVYELYSEGLNYGRRAADVVDRETVSEIIRTASEFLADSVQEDGQFIYGWYPTYDRQLTSYNILRHAGTIWSLVNQYKTTGDEALIAKIDSALGYLVEDSIEYDESLDNVAWIIERKSDEVKLGGNAVAIVALIDYMEEFGSDRYADIVISLGNGILELLDGDTGKYYHVLNYPDYTRKEEYRTVYYDGEATFALAKLYGFMGGEEYLAGATAAVEHFIREDYTQYADHWVAYAMNEITKHVPDERYFNFALRNADVNLNAIYSRETSYHTYMELLMATFELYDRMMEDGVEVAYLEEFNDEYFIETIFHRAQHMLSGYCYPEYVMYLKNPRRILGAFFVRHDGYRVRIDDVQHFVGGYYSYGLYYDKLLAYRDGQ